MPHRREDWSYDGSTDPNWQGFEGFITGREEIDRLSGALRHVADPGFADS